MFLSIFIVALDDRTFRNILRQHNTFIIICKPGKDLIRTTVQQTDESDPLLTIILKFNHIGFQFTRTCWNDHRRFHTVAIVFLLLFGCQQYTGTWTVTINRTAFTAALPCFNIQRIYQFFRHVSRQVDGYTDRMVYPLLNTSLHADFLQPVHIIRCSLIVWWFSNQFINFLLGIFLSNRITVGLHPGNKLMMEYYIFFKCVSCLIHKIDTGFRIIRIYLTTASIYRQEYWFDTGSCLCHQTGRTSRSNRQTGNVTTTVFQHIGIQFRISLTQTVYERIFLFTFWIVNFESSTLFRHHYRWTVSCQS